MLEKTFIHIPGIGAEIEKSLWDQGCVDWRDLREQVDRFSCGDIERKKLLSSLTRSIRAKDAGEHQYFKKKLGPKNAWRAYPDFKDSCVFLDIETDGRAGGGSITTIGLYDGTSFRALVRGDDLGNFPDIISRYSMIVTFYGSGFDLPLIQKRFPLTRFDQIHLDLYLALKDLGHSGGLKKIEKEVGIIRSEETAGLTGLDAVRLWRRYTHLRDELALEKLIAYNREDVVNLHTLAEYAYRALWSRTHEDRLTRTAG